MSPAEERFATLLDRWLESLDLHLEYQKLDDAAYWQVREWIEHERPTAWVIDLARKKTLELKALFDARGDLGPDRTAEALELAVFLANLVGSQNVQRFIPLIAAPAAATDGVASPDVRRAGAITAASTATASDTRRVSAVPTAPVEAADTADTQRQRIPDVNRETAAPRSRTHHAHARTAGRVAAREEIRGRTPAAKPGPATKTEAAVVADAVRLLQWGRAWHELAEAIARMSGRPAIDEVRNILRERRPEIEAKAALPDDD